MFGLYDKCTLKTEYYNGSECEVVNRISFHDSSYRSDTVSSTNVQ